MEQENVLSYNKNSFLSLLMWIPFNTNKVVIKIYIVLAK